MAVDLVAPNQLSLRLLPWRLQRMMNGSYLSEKCTQVFFHMLLKCSTLSSRGIQKTRQSQVHLDPPDCWCHRRRCLHHQKLLHDPGTRHPHLLMWSRVALRHQHWVSRNAIIQEMVHRYPPYFSLAKTLSCCFLVYETRRWAMHNQVATNILQKPAGLVSES